MNTLQDMPPVHSCSAESCSYNDSSDCHAGAITIGGDHGHCDTFVEIEPHSGMNRHGLVGACHRSDCVHNGKLECTAASVEIGPRNDVADCLTYQSR